MFKDLNTDFIVGDCLFGAVNRNQNADLDKYGYSSYGMKHTFLDFHYRMVYGVKMLCFFWYEFILIIEKRSMR